MEGPSPKGSRYQPVPKSDGDNQVVRQPYNGGSPSRNSVATQDALAATNGSAVGRMQSSEHGRSHRYTNSSSTLGSLTHTSSIRDDPHATDHDDDTEINSLVDDMRSPAATVNSTNSAFRQSPWTDAKPLEINIHPHDDMTGPTSPLANATHSNTTSPLHLSRTASRDSASLGPHWNDEHDEFDIDDEVNLRRYQLDFTHAARDVPLPAEFRGHTLYDRVLFTVHQSTTLAVHHWQGLRQAARQRRAARLLTMPSERIRYRLQACLLSCCDATDMGIACTATCLLLWIIVGLVVRQTMYYWWTGVVLFVIRVTARRGYDACGAYMAGRRRQRQQQRQQYHRQRGRLGSRQRLQSTDIDAHHIGTGSAAGSPPVDTVELPIHSASTT